MVSLGPRTLFELEAKKDACLCGNSCPVCPMVDMGKDGPTYNKCWHGVMVRHSGECFYSISESLRHRQGRHHLYPSGFGLRGSLIMCLRSEPGLAWRHLLCELPCRNHRIFCAPWASQEEVAQVHLSRALVSYLTCSPCTIVRFNSFQINIRSNLRTRDQMSSLPRPIQISWLPHSL